MQSAYARGSEGNRFGLDRICLRFKDPNSQASCLITHILLYTIFPPVGAFLSGLNLESHNSYAQQGLRRARPPGVG